MSTFTSKWPVLQEHSVGTTDTCDGDGEDAGVVRDERVQEWISGAVAAYLEQCALVQRTAADASLDVVSRNTAVPAGAALGRPATVVISAGATEIYPTSFTVGLRIRALGREGERDEVVNATSVVQLVDPSTGEPQALGDGIRDELIALQHAARYAN